MKTMMGNGRWAIRKVRAFCVVSDDLIDGGYEASWVHMIE